MPAGDLEVIVHQLSENPNVIGYVVLNPEGIPVKYHEKMPYDQVLKYSCLMTDFAVKAKKCLKEMGNDSEIQNFRMRTSSRIELIGTLLNEFILVVAQNCSGKEWKWPEEEKVEDPSVAANLGGQ
jgi:Roadblock/LC7 domain